MTLSLLFLAVDVATVVVCALIVARVMISQPKLRAAQLIALIGFCSLCDAVMGRVDYTYWIEPAYRFSVGELSPIMNLARNLSPALFMLLCHALFAPRRRFPAWLAGLVVVQMLLANPISAFLPAGAPGRGTLTHLASLLLQMGFAVVALFWTSAEWRSDLVEARRRMRLFTLIVVGLDIVAVGLAQIVIDQNSVLNFRVHEASTIATLAILVMVLMRLTGSDLRAHLEPARLPPTPQPAGADTAGVLARLSEAMEKEGLYRQRGLTLRMIAGRVGLPEYRLRRLIHGELGFSNFNAFLHSYRVRDACTRLADPTERRTPILTIALDAGYQSVNTFNRAFREVVGVTPSAYRAGPGGGESRSETT